MDKVTCNTCGFSTDAANIGAHIAMHQNAYQLQFMQIQPQYHSTNDFRGGAFKQSRGGRGHTRPQKYKKLFGNAASLRGKYPRGHSKSHRQAAAMDSDDTSTADDPRTEHNVEHDTTCSPYHSVCVWHHTMTECAGPRCKSLAEYMRAACADSKCVT